MTDSRKDAILREIADTPEKIENTGDTGFEVWIGGRGNLEVTFESDEVACIDDITCRI